MPLNRKIKNLANFTNLQTKKLCIAFETSPYQQLFPIQVQVKEEVPDAEPEIVIKAEIESVYLKIDPQVRSQRKKNIFFFKWKCNCCELGWAQDNFPHPFGEASQSKSDF